MFWNYDINSDCLTVSSIAPDREVKMEHFTQIFVKEKDKYDKDKRRYPNIMQKWVNELVDTFGYDKEDALFMIADWYLDLLGNLSAEEIKKVVDRAFN